MQWDVSVYQATLLTLVIGLAVGIVSTSIALGLSLATMWFRIAGQKFAIAIVSSFLFIPLYVQATAWSAGFGSNGWLRLSQVEASKNPWMGIASVVWIHTCAATPFCFWILATGLRRIHDSSADQALIESGPWFSLRKQILPRLSFWVLGSFIWAFASVQYDMVVTNLFQTPTLCESVYQQVQFGKLRSMPILVAWAVSIFCGLALATGIFVCGFELNNRARPGLTTSPKPKVSLQYQLVISVVAWTLLTVCFVLPWMNLVSRMGSRSTVLDGHSIRYWSILECISSIGHVPDFVEEFGWSLQLSLWSSALSTLIASLLVGRAGGTARKAILFGVIGCLITTPGPLINLVIGQLLNRCLPESLDFVSDRTLLGPILAMQFRVLPVAIGVLWIIRQQYLDRYGELLELERGLPFTMRLKASLHYSSWGYCVALFVGFSVSFGDLASYLLVQPPGVTTLAMRMFELLHYGTKNREAGLAVVLALLGALSSLCLLRAFPRAS